MIFHTEYSTYEIDLEGRRCRRLDSTHEPTPNQGEDGTWREYEHITPIVPEVGTALFIAWGEGRHTMTSLITEVER